MELLCQGRVVKSQTTRSRTLKLNGVIRMNAESDLPIPPWSTEMPLCVVSGSQERLPFWTVWLVVFRPSQLRVSYSRNCQMRLGAPSSIGVLCN